MAYQSLYRRYRPRRFADIRGQEHVVSALRNAVRDDRLGHAHLFSGPRGTGKTTSARILAKVLNCTNPHDGEPCCECESCKAVEAGTSYDVHELDAASNNGVDAMRDLIEKTMLGTPGRFKVYILDEVHMLSKAAEAALLKTLEEPPPHVIFVLATTDPQKVSETVRSRCQKLQFHLLSAEVLTDHVKWVVQDAGLTVTDEAIEVVVRQGGGSARDTLSALEQVVAAGGIAADSEPLDDLIEALTDADPGRAITAVATAVRDGRDARTLTENLVAHLRDCFLSLMSPALVQLPDRSAQRVMDQARRLGVGSIVRAMEVLGELLVELRHAPDPRLLLDVAMVRLTNAAADTSSAALLARVERLEQAMSSGATFTGAGTPAAGVVAPPSTAGAAARARADRLAGNAPAAPSTEPTPAPTVSAAPERAKIGQRLVRPTITGAAGGLGSATGAAGGSATGAAGGLGPTTGDTRTSAGGSTAGAGSSTFDPRSKVRPIGGTGTIGSPGDARSNMNSTTSVGDHRSQPLVEASERTSGDDGAALGGLPSRDELALQWADNILPKLKGLAKAFFAPGRFADSVDGKALFVLPSTTPLTRCEQFRPEVEAAMARHFQRPVLLRLITEAPEPSTSRRGVNDYPAFDDESYDPSELMDAPPGESPLSGAQRLLQAFPGAELLEEQD